MGVVLRSPLLIKDYHHYEILQMNGWYAVNFFMSLIPASILSNWIFYKNGRSILAIVLFHFMVNLSSTVLQTEQFTKGSVTIILLIITGIVIWRNSDFFRKTHW